MEPDAYLQMAASEETHWWFRGRRLVLEAIIRRLNLPENARILELGSGTGGNLAMLSQFGEVTAVELNDAARAIAIAKGVVRDIRAGALPDDLPLADETFSLICLLDVLEHIEDDAASLRTIRRHLAPGGVLLVTVPAFKLLWSAHDTAMHHKRRYERRELKQRLQDSGFSVHRMTYANTLLFPAAVLSRVMDRLLRRREASGSAAPPALLNEAFAWCFGAERFLPGWVYLPFGLSLLAVAQADVGPGIV